MFLLKKSFHILKVRKSHLRLLYHWFRCRNGREHLHDVIETLFEMQCPVSTKENIVISKKIGCSSQITGARARGIWSREFNFRGVPTGAVESQKHSPDRVSAISVHNTSFWGAEIDNSQSKREVQTSASYNIFLWLSPWWFRIGLLGSVTGSKMRLIRFLYWSAR